MNYLVIHKEYYHESLLSFIIRMMYAVIIVGYDSFYYIKNRKTGITGIRYPISELNQHIKQLNKQDNTIIEKIYKNIKSFIFNNSNGIQNQCDSKRIKKLLIKHCLDKQKWYANKIGQTVPFICDVGTEYQSKDDSGFINFVQYEDAEIIECNE